MSRLPQELIDRLAELQELDELRDQFHAAICQVDLDGPYGWRYPEGLILPADIERSFLSGPAH
jgi:hypothetical protein